MVIRHLTTDEFDERVALSEYAFQAKFTPERKESERRYYKPEEHIGFFDERGALLSALMVIPLRIWVNGISIGMGGIANVATWPEARRLGCVSRLLERAFAAMKEQGQLVSMLYPFVFPFYRKYGWELTVERKRYELEPRHLPKRSGTEGNIERISADAPETAALYGAYASRYTGTLDRSEEWWRSRRFDTPASLVLYRSPDGEPEGYLHYTIENRTMTVREWVSISERARRSLWDFIGNHDSMMDRLLMTAPSDDVLPYLLADPRFKQELEPYFMSRIVDAETFLEQYRFESGPEEALTLRLSDAHAPWNDGLFRLTWGEDGQVRTERLQENADAASEAVALDIGALTLLLLGGRCASWLAESGRLNGSRSGIALLERRVPLRTSYLMDGF
ncbi:enhanced intracellular survival protein Eis [Cohnella sp. GCM10020058]|uniref:GNAT family N-acetyltransferase n=1 Tax=Cohnella sp. GCM10020058 TaxID=3317330 RepID=UPI0036282D1E